MFNGKYDTIDKIKALNPDEISSPYEEDQPFVFNLRWSKRIADYLNRTELNLSQAGGSPAESLHLLQLTDLSDVDYIFIELSGIFSFYDRYMFPLGMHNLVPRTPREIEKFLTDGKKDRPELRKKIKEWLVTFDPVSFTDEVMAALEKELQTPEMQDKKIAFIWWRYSRITDDAVDRNRYPFFDKYAVKFPYPGNENNYEAEAMLLDLKLTVYQEHPLGEHMAFPDPHAGIKGNDLIYECIRRHIDEKESTNSW